MRFRFGFWTTACSIALSCCWSTTALADVKLPAIFGSHMVVQRDMSLPVWGTAEPGEQVTVTFDQASQQATADAMGKWHVSFPAMSADGKAHTLTIAGKNTVKLDDILIGEVWVGSGQSNMEWPLTASADPEATIKAANHPQIRLFHVPKVQTPQPAADVNASWNVCSPETIPAFSAALYHFGTRLEQELKVPVGLINSSWGGSPIEPWTVTASGSGQMYNGMIAPLLPFPVRGVIWYQGETNVMQKNGLAYTGKMQELIEGWRNVWKNPNLAFLYVQIAPWKGAYQGDELPKLWEAQVAALKIPGTGMIVTTDLVDNIADIHPKNKRDVGHRLALWALAKTYGKKDLVYSGPLFKSQVIDGQQVRVTFAHTGGALKSRDDKPLTEFEIAGADGKFVPAQAKIDGETIVVSAEGVAEPKVVRFGWHTLANPNLINAAGLPASPFQTENWTGGTGE